MIRLYNKTAYQDTPIRAILTYAARRIGVGWDVVVKITPASRTKPGAFARNSFPYLWHLTRRRITGAQRMKIIGRSVGWITASLPRHPGGVEIEAAEWFLQVALHEMSHIKDFREGTHDAGGRMPRGRRIPHDQRPCEIKAYDRVHDARPRGRREHDRVDDLVLGLALELECGGIRNGEGTS